MSASSTLFLTFFSYIVSLLFGQNSCQTPFVLRSTITFLWISPGAWLAPPMYGWIKGWLQSHCSLSSSTRSCSQRGSVLGLMLCGHSLKFLTICEQKALSFYFGMGCHKLCSWSCLSLIIYDFAELTFFSNRKLIGDDLLDFLDKPFRHLNEVLL